jgi:hypothetical protein
MNDVLTVSIDSNGEDETVMVVAKTIGSTTYVVGEFRNDEAIEMYNKLNQGNPFLKSGLSGE